VLAEVIFIRVYAHLGKKHEALPLCRSAVPKPFLFSLLLLAFHIVEEGSKQLLDRDTMLEFCMILPLLAFRELRRVVGEDNFIRDSMGPSAIHESGHSYFAQTGHSHFAATLH
jgi:hypothetical protein